MGLRGQGQFGRKAAAEQWQPMRSSLPTRASAPHSALVETRRLRLRRTRLPMSDGEGEPALLTLRDGWVPECSSESATPHLVYGQCVGRSDPIPVVVRGCWAAGWRSVSQSDEPDAGVLARMLGARDSSSDPHVPVASGAYDDTSRPLVRLSEFLGACSLADTPPCSEKQAPYLKDCHIALHRRAAARDATAAGRATEAAPSTEHEEPRDGLLVPPPFADDALNGFWRLRPRLQGAHRSGAATAGAGAGAGAAAGRGAAAAAGSQSACDDSDEDDTLFLYAGGLGTGTGLHEDVVASHSWSASVRGAKSWMFWPPGRAAAIGLADASGDALVTDARSAGLWEAVGAAFREGLLGRRRPWPPAAQRASPVDAAWETDSAALPPLPEGPADLLAAAAEPLEWREGAGGPAQPAAHPGPGAVALLVQWPGDVVFVPAGWHHAVYNLPFEGAGARRAGPPLCISVNANWLSGSALPGLAALVLREVASARRMIADCISPGMGAAAPGVDAAEVDAAWEWQCQRMVRASARLDVADVCQLVFARAAAALGALRGELGAGSDDAAGGAAAWVGAAPSSFAPMQPALLLPDHAALLRRMHRDAARGALEAIALLEKDPFVAWLRAQPDAADSQCRRQAASVQGEGCAWRGESKAFHGCRMLGLGWFWQERLAAALREAAAVCVAPEQLGLQA